MHPETDVATFFLMVESSRRRASEVRWASMVELSARLSALTDGELAWFSEIYHRLNHALDRVSVDGKSLHELVHDAWGGCSDDSFMDFRSWVLWRGRATFEAVGTDPVAFLARERGDRFEGAIFSPLYNEEKRRGAIDAPPTPVDAALWARRAEAERLLLEGTLPGEGRADPDPYVRTLTVLAHPPVPDAELFDSPVPVRSAVYLAATRALPPGHLEPLTAMLVLDGDAPVRGLLPLVRAAFAPVLAGALAPYQAVLEALGAHLEPEEPADALAHDVLEALLSKKEDPFARARALPVREIATALARSAQARSTPKAPRTLLQALAGHSDPLAVAVLAGAYQDSPIPSRFRREIQDSSPAAALALYRSQGDEGSWEYLRSALKAPAVQLACRLDALADGARSEESLSAHDPLSFPRRLALECLIPADWPVDASPVVLRWLLQRPASWLDPYLRQVREGEREQWRTSFSEGLRESLVAIGPPRPDPLERQLLHALREAPGAAAPRLVYLDWCQQMEREPWPFLLMEVLRSQRERRDEDRLLRPLDAALAAAALGDPIGLEALVQALERDRGLQEIVVDALWGLGPEAAPALPVLARLEATHGPAEVDLAALLLTLQPEEPAWAERLRAALPPVEEQVPEREEIQREGLITERELERFLGVVRRGNHALSQLRMRSSSPMGTG